MGPLSSPLVRSHLRSPVRPRATLARRGAAAVAGLAAFGLVGCGSDETDTPTPAPATSSPAPAASPSAATGSATPSATPTAAGNAEALVAAGRTALAEVSGATLVSIETDTDAGTTVWEVQLVNADGDEQELDVSADGGDVVRTSAVDRQDSGDRRDNLARVAGAEIGYAAAVEALPSSVAGGTISELALDTDRGRVVWDAEVRDSGGREHEVTVDAGSGDVVRDRT